MYLGRVAQFESESPFPFLLRGLNHAWCPSLQTPTGNTLLDLTRFARNGTLEFMDPPTDWVFDGGGRCLDFDGTNDLVRMTSFFYPSNTITVSLWYLSRALPPSGFEYNYCFLSCQEASIPYRGFDIRGFTTTSLDCALVTGGTARNVGLGSISTNVWTQIAFTYDGANLIGFRNGIQQATTSATGTIDATSANLCISNNPNAAGRRINGLIDDVRIYSRALHATEVATLARYRGIGLIGRRRRIAGSVASTGNRRRRVICGANC